MWYKSFMLDIDIHPVSRSKTYTILKFYPFFLVSLGEWWDDCSLVLFRQDHGSNCLLHWSRVKSLMTTPDKTVVQKTSGTRSIVIKRLPEMYDISNRFCIRLEEVLHDEMVIWHPSLRQ